MGAADLHAFLDQAVREMAGLLGWDRCSILLVEDGTLRHGAAVGLTDDWVAAVDGLPVGPHIGTCGRAAATGEIVVTRDVTEQASWAGFFDLAAHEGVRCCWSVPFFRPDGRVLGTFANYGPEPTEPTATELDVASTLASIVGLGVESVRCRARRSSAHHATIQALTLALDARDRYTGRHSTATSELAAGVGRRLGLDGDRLTLVEQVALLHDVGKLAIPNQILHNPQALDPGEWTVMRTHPEVGERILAHVGGFEPVAHAVRHEHERWDGTGYPDGLAGSHIPIASRIVFACDAFHAMTSDRPYRAAIGREAALDELRSGAGSQFDPAVVAALLGELGERPEPVMTRPQDAEQRAQVIALEAIARAIGADDLFVFRRIGSATFAHTGGVGRGEGWAGNIELSAEDEAHFARAVRACTPECLAFEQPERVAGPYYCRSAVIAPVGDDCVVVLGSASDALTGACTEETMRFARRAAGILQSVSPAKRLADELEVLEAVRAVTTVPAEDVEGTLRAIADRAAAALSCEFGAVVAFEHGVARVGWSERGWRPGGEDLADRLVDFAARYAGREMLIQDAQDTQRALAGVGDAAGAAAVLVAPIGAEGQALLVAVHADPVRRGFTSLCRRVAHAVSEAAEAVVRRALAREELALENAMLARRVRTDALTGVANRLAWDELVEAEELHRARSRNPVSVVVFDVDGLKRVNDTHGHQTGDELLRGAAAILAAHTRATDLVARLGGDEFGVLLRYCDEASAERWCDRVLNAVADLAPVADGVSVALSCGCTEVAPGATIAETFAHADRRMYASRAAR